MAARWMACYRHDEPWWSDLLVDSGLNCPASAVASSRTLSRRIPRARLAGTMPRRSLPRLFAERMVKVVAVVLIASARLQSGRFRYVAPALGDVVELPRKRPMSRPGKGERNCEATRRPTRRRAGAAGSRNGTGRPRASGGPAR